MKTLVESFLVYLQNNNTKTGNKYQPAWLNEQAKDFQVALSYSLELILPRKIGHLAKRPF